MMNERIARNMFQFSNFKVQDILHDIELILLTNFQIQSKQLLFYVRWSNSYGINILFDLNTSNAKFTI